MTPVTKPTIKRDSGTTRTNDLDGPGGPVGTPMTGHAEGGPATHATMPAEEPEPKPRRNPAGRFYRPELDALRFFAFLLVLVHHGPNFPGPLNVIRGMGAYGLSLFFLLSAYLITELLLREREQTNNVSWGLFFIRRALRIWPLYFGAIAALIVVSLLRHQIYVSRLHLLEMAFFVANWFPGGFQLGPLTAHLWSISVEEQFYLIWPPLMKFGGKRAILAASVVLAAMAPAWMLRFSSRGWWLWYDTPVEFLFFAAGASIALYVHRGVPERSRVSRVLLLALSIAMFAGAVWIGPIGTDGVSGIGIRFVLLGYGMALAGCVAVFFAALGLARVPRWLTYLGKISYGLYVFHVAMMRLSFALLAHFHIPQSVDALIIDSLATLLTIAVAHLSYQYFEKPFLRIKERFTVVQSRPT
jgi:peptidoglycan/LPS O-acetylase OafA/YrhL